MEDQTALLIAKKDAYPAKVIAVLSDTQIVIDKGVDYLIRLHQRVLLYNPNGGKYINGLTGELGIMEEVKGQGEVIPVKQNTSLIEFCGTRFYPTLTPKTAFDNPLIGDLIKPI